MQCAYDAFCLRWVTTRSGASIGPYVLLGGAHFLTRFASASRPFFGVVPFSMVGEQVGQHDHR